MNNLTVKNEEIYFKVCPILCPAFDWEVLLTELSLLGKRPSAVFDKENCSKDIRSLISAIDSCNNHVLSVNESVRHGSSVHKLLDFGFFVSTSSPDFPFYLLNGLIEVITISNQVCPAFILKGSLRQWKQALVELCQPKTKKDCLKIFNLIFCYFEQLNLRELWHDYEKLEHSGTFILELR